MLQKLFKTNDDFIPTIARIGLGLVILPHGLQKLVGLFGGYGFSGTMNFFTESVGLPWILAFLVIIIESFGALALIAGFLTRLSALGVSAIMAAAILMVHGQHGFFMNWFGGQKGEGFEYHILVMVLALVAVIAGAGRWSLDSIISKRIEA